MHSYNQKDAKKLQSDLILMRRRSGRVRGFMFRFNKSESIRVGTENS